MKIVVAMDSFKGSLTAVRACDIVAEAVRSVSPDAEVVTKPMADGGEGTAAVLMAACGGKWIEKCVMGPLPDMKVNAGFVWLAEDKTAVVEMAAASGLTLLPPERRNPLCTTTYGTGVLLKAAIDYGAGRILLAVGGSATVDGGVGAAMALGWRFLTKDRQQIALGGGELLQIAKIVGPRVAACPESGLVRRGRSMRRNGTDRGVEVLCDVDNPLCGPHGAARVYGPQKGATPQMVETLDAGLAHLARLIRDQLGRDVADLPGAGAAGGLAAGAVAFMNARLVSGIDTVMSQSRLQEAMIDADWVITGEGCFDAQSLRGKVVCGVARLAKASGAKVCVLAGQVLLPAEKYRAAGVETALACMDGGMQLDYAIANAEPLLARAARRFAGDCLNA
jgi:glycerate kinase